MLYNGDQAGGGDRFAACISHPGIDFSLTVESSSTTTQGMYQSNVAFPNLLLLNSSDPSAGTGTAVEMQSAALLIAPGTLPICVG